MTPLLAVALLAAALALWVAAHAWAAPPPACDICGAPIDRPNSAVCDDCTQGRPW